MSDLYSSPILEARPGSMHGYDICNHTRLNPELGGEDGFPRLADALKNHSLGFVLDIVPNHMGIGHPCNLWWNDVLENGSSSIHAPFFDIDWHPVNPALYDKVLLPILGDQYGAVLERGELRLSFEDGAFFVNYYENKLPLAPRSYVPLLELYLDTLTQALGLHHEHVSELKSIITAISYLPPRTELEPDKIIERNREKEVIKKRLAVLAQASVPVREAITSAIQVFNGKPDDRHSFDRLDALLDDQAYRLAFWRVSAEEINYRRFFDINDLAAIRVEKPEVFQATHERIFQLLAQGQLQGLRIDHPDGLWDPTAYFRALQTHYLIRRIRHLLGPGPTPETLDADITALLDAHIAAAKSPAPWPLYVVAEKILGDEEPLPADWAVDGTTGYDFLAAVGSLFVDSAKEPQFDALYDKFIGQHLVFENVLNSRQKMIMLVSLASELNSLSHLVDRLSERNRRYRDFTLNSLTFVLREIIACLPVYRTYIAGPGHVSLRDRRFIEEAAEIGKRNNPRTPAAIFDFVRDTLLLRNFEEFRTEDRPRVLEFVMKLQQLTGPVLAKAMEDTTFYVYNRLVSLNEVGGHPPHFGLSVEDFHRQNIERCERWPHAMLASSTHDTKRSEDVRARISVLSELPREWEACLSRWSQLNQGRKSAVADTPAPDANDEYLLYQTLLGAWPAEPLTPEAFANFRDRIVAYMTKATKEAKVHTSWVNANEQYDAAVIDFAKALLPDNPQDPFLTDLQSFQKRIAWFGYCNSLSQTLLKFTCPGVPDIYQGTELWDFSLVDPDNRRPVDYRRRRAYLQELKERIEKENDNLLPLAQELLDNLPDGRCKLYLIHRLLTYRRARESLFRTGSYVPLSATGGLDKHLCSFLRTQGDSMFLAAAPRLIAGLTGGVEQFPTGVAIWKETRLVLPLTPPSLTFRNLFTGESVIADSTPDGPSLLLAKVLAHFPVALLEPLP